MTNDIEIHQLHYRAGRAFEIKQLDLNVPLGAIYGFLGPNGSGKTTTMRLVLGLLRPLAGRITVLGDAIPANAPRVLARVGFVPEQPHRSEEHTSELQSRLHLVCRLLLEKKKKAGARATNAVLGSIDINDLHPSYVVPTAQIAALTLSSIASEALTPVCLVRKIYP